MQETRVRFLGREDPLEKEMAIHSSIVAWRISWTEEPGRLQSMGSQESDMTEQLNTHILIISDALDHMKYGNYYSNCQKLATRLDKLVIFQLLKVGYKVG